MSHPLIGRAVIFDEVLPKCGRFAGIVRVVTEHRTKALRGKVRTLVVQRPGGDRASDGSTYSARCGGDRRRLDAGQVRGVRWRRRYYSLDEFLKSGLGIKAAEAEE